MDVDRRRSKAALISLVAAGITLLAWASALISANLDADLPSTYETFIAVVVVGPILGLATGIRAIGRTRGGAERGRRAAIAGTVLSSIELVPVLLFGLALGYCLSSG